MQEEFKEICEAQLSIGGVTVDYAPLVWAIVQATQGRSPEEIAMVVLGQLSPADCLPCDLIGVDYPNDHGADELVRHQTRNELAAAVKKREPTLLSELMEGRLGTTETYSIVLAIALTAHNIDCHLAITGPDADPANYLFVCVGERQLDLYSLACGVLPRRLRPHKKISL